MLIPSKSSVYTLVAASLSRRVNANSQRQSVLHHRADKLIKKGEC